MTSGKSDIQDITLHLRRDDPAKGAVAFWDGIKTDHHDREMWIWLPRDHIDYEVIEGDLCEVQIPEWLAMREGLI